MQSLILPAATLPWPVDWTAVFGQSAPLLVEIGFGGGEFLWHLRQKRPNCNLLGVEIALPSLRKAEKRFAASPQVRLIHSEALSLLWLYFAPQTIQGLYLNFPDPWPRHHHRRLINGRFLHLAATRLAAGATLYMATDIADYAEAIAVSLADTPYFTNYHPTPFVTEDHERPITKYERLAQQNGRTCHYFHWQRNHTPAANPFVNPLESPAFRLHISGDLLMPHVIFRSPLSLDEIGRRFAPFRADTAEIHVRFLEMFQSRHDGKLVLETFVKEEPLEQRVGIALEPHSAGNYIMNLREIGFPRPTPGIRFAIQQLAQWLITLHPEIEIERSSVPIET